jgi:hypothetical protein
MHQKTCQNHEISLKTACFLSRSRDFSAKAGPLKFGSASGRLRELGGAKKNKRPKARVFVPPARGKKALAGGENTPGQKIKETKEKKHSNLTRNFFLFFSRGILTPN